LIGEALAEAEEQILTMEDRPYLDDLLAKPIVHNTKPGEGIMEPYVASSAG